MRYSRLARLIASITYCGCLPGVAFRVLPKPPSKPARSDRNMTCRHINLVMTARSTNRFWQREQLLRWLCVDPRGWCTATAYGRTHGLNSSDRACASVPPWNLKGKFVIGSELWPTDRRIPRVGKGGFERGFRAVHCVGWQVFAFTKPHLRWHANRVNPAPARAVMVRCGVQGGACIKSPYCRFISKPRRA